MSEIIRLFNAYASALQSTKAHLEMARSAYRDELDQCRTMADVDAVLRPLVGDEELGPFFASLRREQFETRHGITRDGNLIRARFGGG